MHSQFHGVGKVVPASATGRRVIDPEPLDHVGPRLTVPDSNYTEPGRNRMRGDCHLADWRGNPLRALYRQYSCGSSGRISDFTLVVSADADQPLLLTSSRHRHFEQMNRL